MHLFLRIRWLYHDWVLDQASGILAVDLDRLFALEVDDRVISSIAAAFVHTLVSVRRYGTVNIRGHACVHGNHLHSIEEMLPPVDFNHDEAPDL